MSAQPILELAFDPTLDDSEVLARVRAGETRLFEVLMRRNNQRIYRAARAIVRDESEVEDVMQEAYTQAFRHLDHFQGKARFSTWLTRIAVHEAIARLRKLRRLGELDDEAEMSASADDRAATPESDTSDGELRSELERAIDSLPENFRCVFLLRAVEGLSVSETAASLSIPEDTVKTRLFRARALLQKLLAGSEHVPVDTAFRFLVPRCNRIVDAVLRTIARPRLS
jgi:RNA polymerase sigma-70 factor (ECF subfamily)